MVLNYDLIVRLTLSRALKLALDGIVRIAERVSVYTRVYRSETWNICLKSASINTNQCFRLILWMDLKMLFIHRLCRHSAKIDTWSLEHTHMIYRSTRSSPVSSSVCITHTIENIAHSNRVIIFMSYYSKMEFQFYDQIYKKKSSVCIMKKAIHI